MSSCFSTPFASPVYKGRQQKKQQVTTCFFLSFMAASTSVGGSEIQRSPVEVGSLPTIVSKVLHIPGGDRRI